MAEAVGSQYRAFVLTAAFTSMRWGERRPASPRTGPRPGLGQRASQPDRVRGPAGGRAPPKNDSVRVVTLPDLLVTELRAHLEERVAPGAPNPLVFAGERGATPRRGNWRSKVHLREAVAKAGLPEGFHFHDLRHAGNHLVAQSGVSTRELMQRMGHSTVRAVPIYQHATEPRSRVQADRLDALVRAEPEARTEHEAVDGS